MRSSYSGRIGVKEPSRSTSPKAFSSGTKVLTKKSAAWPPKKAATINPAAPRSGTSAVVTMNPMRRTLTMYSCRATIRMLRIVPLLHHGDEDVLRGSRGRSKGVEVIPVLTSSSGESCGVIRSSVSVGLRNTRDDLNHPIEVLKRILTREDQGDCVLDTSTGLYSACDFDLRLASRFEL